MTNKLDNLLFSMFTENTGTHFLDSGGAYGRNWQNNKDRTVQSFIDAPAVMPDLYDDKLEGWTVDSFHFLREQLDLDDLCNEFNSLPCDDWDGDYHGTSADQSTWLELHGFEHGHGFNTYNDPDNYPLSQVLQGEHFTREGDFGTEYYVLIQVHGGCDVRGGYTDAKLFLLDNEYAYDDGYLVCGHISGIVNDEITFDTDGPYVTSTDDGCTPIDLPTIKSIDMDIYYGC